MWRFFGRTRRGSLLLEALVAIGIFSIFLSGIGLALVLGERATVVGGDYARAGFLAEEQLEALRHMQENDFALLVPGTYGIGIVGDTWAFSGSSVIRDGFTASVTIAEQDEDRRTIRSNVSWNFGPTRSGSVVLSTVLTNWREASTVGDWSSVALAGSSTVPDSPDLRQVAVNGSYAYVTGAAGAGLYVYDISTPASPTRVSSSFSLGGGAYGLTIAGDLLFLATTIESSEVMIYDISDPENLGADDLIDSYDLPGSAGARAIAVYGDMVFVGTADDAVNDQFYALLRSEDDPLEALSSLSISGSVLDMSLSEGYAYVASSNNAGEFLVIDLIDPENLQYAPGSGIDMTDSFDGLSMVTSGTSALIGRMNGSAIEEVTLYEIGWSPVPSPPPGPWTVEIGGDANALFTIEGTRYAFVGGNASASELRVLDLMRLAQNQSATLTTVNVGDTIRGFAYDWLNDTLLAVTAGDQLLLYQPD